LDPTLGEYKAKHDKLIGAMDEGRKRVIAIIAGILAAPHFKTPSDLFGERGGQHSESDRIISACVQWAERILTKVNRFSNAPH
jgi:hypothetical protein